jgi:hypothetical protein
MRFARRGRTHRADGAVGAPDADEETPGDAGRTLRRRGLIAGAAALAAGVAFKQGEQAADAADGGNLVLGSTANTATGNTTLSSGATTSGTALTLHCDNANYGIGLSATGTGYGVTGTGNTYAGVFGDTSNSLGAGVTGLNRSSDGGSGVTGGSDGPSGVGVFGLSQKGAGVVGFAGSFSTQPPGGPFGVVGTGTGATALGGLFQGDRAPLRLVPSADAGAPSLGAHQRGELVVDSNGTLWLCTADGSPGTWVALNSPKPVLQTLPTPERFVDTRANVGGLQGPVEGGTAHTFVMTGRNGQSGNPALRVPDNALSLVGNLTVVGAPGVPLGSYVTIWPGGPIPTVSNINFGPSSVTGAVANSFVVALTNVAGHGQLNVFNQSMCDYILDVTGYYVSS